MVFTNLASSANGMFSLSRMLFLGGSDGLPTDFDDRLLTGATFRSGILSGTGGTKLGSIVSMLTVLVTV